jgi:ribosomal-protein-alanine N-acetyltransferase
MDLFDEARSPLKRPETRTRRLILRALKPSDYQEWFDALVNSLPAQNRWDLSPKSSRQCSKRRFNNVMARHQEKARTDDWYWFGVFEKSTGRLVGHLDFDVFVRSTHQFANFGYQIYNRHWGKGYGQEASAAGLKIGFKHLKLNRLEAAINLDNKKSIRLVKKRYWFEYGNWVDHLIYVANPEDLGLKPTKPF